MELLLKFNELERFSGALIPMGARAWNLLLWWQGQVKFDAGLVHATRIVELDASINKQITTTVPFAANLRSLVADGDSALDDAGLAAAAHIVFIRADGNAKITRSRLRR